MRVLNVIDEEGGVLMDEQKPIDGEVVSLAMETVSRLTLHYPGWVLTDPLGSKCFWIVFNCKHPTVADFKQVIRDAEAMIEHCEAR